MGAIAIFLLVDGRKAPPAQVVRFSTMHVARSGIQVYHAHKYRWHKGMHKIRGSALACTSCICLLHSSPSCDHAEPDPLQLTLVMFSTIKWHKHVSMYTVSVSVDYIYVAARFVWLCVVYVLVYQLGDAPCLLTAWTSILDREDMQHIRSVRTWFYLHSLVCQCAPQYYVYMT